MATRYYFDPFGQCKNDPHSDPFGLHYNIRPIDICIIDCLKILYSTVYYIYVFKYKNFSILIFNFQVSVCGSLVKWSTINNFSVLNLIRNFAFENFCHVMLGSIWHRKVRYRIAFHLQRWSIFGPFCFNVDQRALSKFWTV